MAGKRTYADPCGVARALDLVGDRWALLVVRELLLGPKRFTDLRTGLPNVGPDVLAQRLRDLERAGIVRRDRLAPPAAARIYELTPRGAELEPVILALGRWGSRAPFPAVHGPLSVDAFAVALKTLFDPRAAAGVRGRVQLVVEGQPLRARIDDAGLELRRGEAPEADAVISGSTASLTRVLWHGLPLEEALRTGEVTITGEQRLARSFLSCFPLRQSGGQ